MINATGILPQAASNSGTTMTTATGLPTSQGLNNMFMQLLMAQLKNQSPLNPMDPTQFVGQLAQFSELSTVTSIYQLMTSVAETYRGLAMGVIMTGMGSDGAQGMGAIYRQGGFTIGQDEASCTVYGMPRACAELGVLSRVVPLAHIPQPILQATHYRKHA